MAAYVHRPGEAEPRWLGETFTCFLAGGEQTAGAFALVDERAQRGESVPLHRHVDDMESFYVVEGEITLYIGDEPHVLAGPGAFAHVPGGTVHGFRAAARGRLSRSSGVRSCKSTNLPSIANGADLLDRKT